MDELPDLKKVEVEEEEKKVWDEWPEAERRRYDTPNNTLMGNALESDVKARLKAAVEEKKAAAVEEKIAAAVEKAVEKAAAEKAPPTSAMSNLSVVSMETAGRFTAAEFENTCNILKNEIKGSERLVCHFTTLQSAQLILKSGSYGLRASAGGQAGGGLSVCVKMPHELGWEQRRGGDFLSNVGSELWGEKAAQAPAGTQVCLLLKIRKTKLDGAKKVPGRDAIRIIEAEELGDGEPKPDGHYYLSQRHIVKAYNLMED